jgi:hypothetical protein
MRPPHLLSAAFGSKDLTLYCKLIQLPLASIASAGDKKAASASSADRIKEAMAWGARQMKYKEDGDENE